MKTIITQTMTLGLILISLVSIAHSSEKKDSTAASECLAITGIAVDEKNIAINGAEIKLFKQNEEMEWIEVTNVEHHDHNFRFLLNVNEHYSIEISKPGYIKRLISVSTELPSNVSITPIFNYAFEVTLLTEKKNSDNFYQDFPIALISYNPKTQVFEEHKNYTKHIKLKIKESNQQAKN